MWIRGYLRCSEFRKDIKNVKRLRIYSLVSAEQRFCITSVSIEGISINSRLEMYRGLNKDREASLQFVKLNIS